MALPPRILREQLTARRQAGASFPEAWPHAVAVALQSTSRDERQEWADALDATLDAWRDAWLRLHRRRARSNVRLSRSVKIAACPCPTASVSGAARAPIPPERGRCAPAKYCSEACRHLAGAERERLAGTAA